MFQFRTPSTGVPSSFAGCVERLVSSEVACFYTLEELLAFMIRVLTELQSQAVAP